MKFTPVNIWLLACSLLSPWLAGAQVSFNRDIRPIMSDTCFRCHGPDKSARMMDLRLDIRDQALKPLVDNKIPIVPGKPEQSEIIRRIFATDQSEIMPPEYAHKALTQAQKEIIRQWVAEGAKYEGHWSFQPVKRPPVPKLSGDPALVENPTDAFIQARLAKPSHRRERPRRSLASVVGTSCGIA
jgi:Planctomycete cytochrome C